MFFGGIQKSSLIDFPGRVGCVLFLSGCNFNCPYCHNPDLVKGKPKRTPTVNERVVFDFLERRKGWLDGVVISGGEPTLDKGLSSLCEKVKRMGYAVKLDTNGSRPGVIRRLVNDGLVDYIAMDIKTDPFQYAPFVTKDSKPHDLLSSVQIIMESARAYEFRTTCVKPLVDAHVTENIAKTIKGAMLYALQRFHDTKVLRPEFFTQNGAAYNEDELMHLKTIAEPWVKRCIVR